MEIQEGSVMDGLRRIPDPRRRQGRRYNLPGLVGMLLLAALHGETSLRGMWLWGCHQWERIAGPLELWGTKGPPSYGAVRELMARIDVTALAQALGMESQTETEAGYSVDGKVLRGSKRATQPALRVVTAVGHQFQQIWGQQAVVAGDEVGAAVALLQQMPLAERIVSLDAGLLQRPVVKTIEEKGGPTSAPSKPITASSMT